MFGLACNGFAHGFDPPGIVGANGGVFRFEPSAGYQAHCERGSGELAPFQCIDRSGMNFNQRLMGLGDSWGTSLSCNDFSLSEKFHSKWLS